MYLRDVIKEKLEWAQVERQKSVETINGFVNQIKTLENQTRQVESLENIIIKVLIRKRKSLNGEVK